MKLLHSKKALALGFAVLFNCTMLLAQKTVTGKVISEETGRPVEGATVAIKGSKQSAVTNERGEFSLNVAKETDVLVISFVGMTKQEVKVAEKSTFSITLKNDDSNLDDVVVIGYGTEKRSRINSSVVTVKMSEIEDMPVGNVGQALTGRLLGVGVSGGDARPGTAASLTVRNPISLAKDGGTTDPLYVIDDVIQINSNGRSDATLFNTLDMSEIESLTILKDAQAAIYGSRGANGVVLVKTKRGKTGKPRITYSGSYAINDESYRTKMMSASELAQYINIVNGPYGANSPAAVNNFFSQDEIDHFKTINHDWLEQAWKASYNMRNSINISGGSDKATYFASVSRFNQNANIGSMDYNRWNFRAGSEITVATGFKVNLNVSGTQTDELKMNNKIGGENVESDYRNLLRAPRYVPTYIDGYPVRLPGPTGETQLSGYHFFDLDKLHNYMDQKSNAITFNASVEYEVPFLKGLKIRGSYNRSDSRGSDWRLGTKYTLYNFSLLGENKHIYEGATNPTPVVQRNDNRIFIDNSESQLEQSNLTISYAKSIGQHSFDVFATVEKGEVASKSSRGLKDDPILTSNGQFNTAYGAMDVSSTKYEGGSLGYIGRASYSYGKKYSASFMMRSDASTKFAPENYWKAFYSLGVGWTISEEDFFKSSVINYLKLRYSFGHLGKDELGMWQWRQRYTYQNGQGGVFGTNDNNPANTGMKMELSPNRAAKWSDEYKHNAGIDITLLNNRLNLSVDGFYNMGRNMLMELTQNVPVSIGGTVASQNYGSMDFFGYEIGAGWNDKIGKDFTYGIDVRFSWSDNKMIKGNFNDIDILRPWIAKPNQSRDNGKWGHDYLGMFRSQEEIDAYVKEYNITSVFGTRADQLRIGMLYYRDVRGQLQADGTFAPPDGIIDINDQVQLTKKSSNLYGLSSTIRMGYKGFQFNAVLTGSFGGWAEFDARERLTTNISQLFQNGVAYWADIYDPQLNPNGKYPNPNWNTISTTPTSSFWQVSAFRMRVANAALSYNLPKSIVQKAKMQSAKVILTVLNPVELFNPFGYKSTMGSWDTYPSLRTYSLGVNVGF